MTQTPVRARVPLKREETTKTTYLVSASDMCASLGIPFGYGGAELTSVQASVTEGGTVEVVITQTAVSHG